MSRTLFAILALFAGTAAAFAGTDNGNDLARRLSTCRKGQEAAMEKEATGHLFFFRYLRVADKQGSTNSQPARIAFKTVEPSSDMYVEFVVTKAESLKIADSTQVGESLAVTGRIKSISKADNRIVLDPVIVRYKDRSTPKVGKELLCEVDPNARYGTDTSSGEEAVVKQGEK